MASARPTATVLPFRRLEHPRAGGRSQAAGGFEETSAPWLDRLFESSDGGLNAEWDRLVSLVVQAWCWRDPESVAELEACLASVRRAVDRDWS
jgi:hypothetical protein